MPRTPASPSNLSVDDGARLSRVVQASAGIRRPLQCLLWLQGELQHFVPHQVLIVARGNFVTGEVRYDVVAPPEVDTRPFLPRETGTFLRRLYKRWIASGRRPVILAAPDTSAADEEDVDNPASAVPEVGTLIAHASKDDRRRRDCLCVAMHLARGLHVGSPAALEVLFPHIDNALRRVSAADRRRRAASLAVDSLPASNLSPRELEILEWVGKGKTNHEIALILDISPYTVKNHLQHIFRKLDVLNRAQAVGKYAGESTGQLIRFSHG